MQKRNDKNIPSEKGYSEASTSYVMYFSEGDWCRSLESPPEDEEGSPNRKRKRNTEVVEAEVQGQEVIRIVRRIDVVVVLAAAVVDRRLILDLHTVAARDNPGLRVVQPREGAQ